MGYADMKSTPTDPKSEGGRRPRVAVHLEIRRRYISAR